MQIGSDVLEHEIERLVKHVAQHDDEEERRQGLLNQTLLFFKFGRLISYGCSFLRRLAADDIEHLSFRFQLLSIPEEERGLGSTIKHRWSRRKSWQFGARSNW
ncbi:MAG: hypothetical protein U0K19_04600 [Bifidobacteriaceae bacterium]|nr:hypothetical protein [Bifidobacteriaceae bacterium]